MGKLVIATRTHIDRSEHLRMVLLSGLSFALGLVFLGLLVADEARAVSF